MLRKPKNDLTFQISIAACLSLLVIVLIIIVGLDTRNIARNIVSIRTEINTQNKQSKDIAVLREEAFRAEQKQEVLEGLLPKKDELFSFPKEITNLGSQSDVGVSFSFGNEGSDQIDYSLTAQGSYANIVDFVKKIEDDFAFINISEFTLISRENGYGIDLKGNAFFNGTEG